MDNCNILIYPSAGINDRDFPWLYYDIIERLFDRRPMLISQFIDISQHYKDIKQHENEISELFDIDMIKSRDFVDLEKAKPDAEIYYLHFKGEMNGSWLHHLVGFGGASLSTIIWPNDQNSNFCELLEWNSKLITWLFEETENLTLLNELVVNHSFFCIVVDGRLWILFPEGILSKKIIQLTESIFKLYGYLLEVNIEDW
jgi:hypothetical protein